jgi:hypothetical protein
MCQPAAELTAFWSTASREKSAVSSGLIVRSVTVIDPRG